MAAWQYFEGWVMATVPDTMSQDDPWAWLNWAQQRDPGTYGWRDLGATGADPISQMLLEQAGLYSADNPVTGYTMRDARGPGYQRMTELLGPDGQVVTRANPDAQDSFHSDTYRNAAGTIGAVLGAGYGLSSLAGAGAGAGAAAGEGLGTMGTIGAGSGQYAALPSVLESSVSLGSVPAVSGTVAGGGGITAGQAAGAASAAGSLSGGGTVDPYGAGSGWGQDTLSAMGATNDTAPSWLNSLSGLVGSNGMIPWQNVLGAYAGYQSSQDQQQTSSRDPWSGAQPMLRGLLDQGQSLQQQYANQPFSPQQQTAYNNLGGLLSSINSSAPGLLSGASANASGANNYDRANPRKALTGSGGLSGFNPEMLKFFGG